MCVIHGRRAPPPSRYACPPGAVGPSVCLTSSGRPGPPRLMGPVRTGSPRRSCHGPGRGGTPPWPSPVRDHFGEARRHPSSFPSAPNPVRYRYMASARVCHVASGISGYRSDFATYHGTRNRIWLFIRNLPTGLLIALLPGHITMNLVMLGRSVLQRNGTATWRGMCDALRGLPQVLAARRIIQSGRTVGMLRIAGTIEWSLRTRHGYRNRPVRRATSLWKQFLFRNS
jgi:hypothetical protein